MGVFSGCTPFIGFHLGIAFVLATLFRLNRLWAMVGSRVSMTLFLAPIVFVEIEGAHWVRTGRWAPGTLEDIWAQRRELATDWLLGSGVVGPVLAAILGLLAYRAALRWASARSPAGPLPPSSGSRPSAPPAPPA